MKAIDLRIRKMHDDVETPIYASNGAACFDIFAFINPSEDVYIQPGTTKIFNTGIQVEVPVGYVLQIFSRSGHGFKNNVRLNNCVGIIDSDYRGEICVKLIQDESSDSPFVVKNGDRIAQAMIVEIPTVNFVLIEDLSQTDRGNGGFGSTGA